MKWAPFENFYIISPLKPDVIEERLRQEVDTTSFFSLKYAFKERPDFSFSGSYGSKRFRMVRLMKYRSRNSFRPIIIGAIEPWSNGSIIHVKMRMYVPVMIFVFGTTGFLVADFFLITADNIKQHHFDGIQLVVLAVAVFIYGLATLSFNYERRKGTEKLLKMFDGGIKI